MTDSEEREPREAEIPPRPEAATEAQENTPAERVGEEPDPMARVLKMQKTLLRGHSELKQDLLQAVANGVSQLGTNVAMVAKSLKTARGVSEANDIEMRKLIANKVDELSASMQGELLEQVVARVMLDAILPVLDDLDRVLAADRGDGAASTAYEAIRMIRSKLWGGVAVMGAALLPIDEGESKFDEHLHECSERRVGGGSQVNVISSVIRPGYTLNGRVVRRAQVAVKGV